MLPDNTSFTCDWHRITDESSLYILDGGIHGIEILDTAGLHQFPAMRQLGIQSGRAFIVVFSVDSHPSFKEALRLVDLVIEVKGGSP